MKKWKTITFSRSGAITIYHGNDGSTPQISVKQESDGIYYWTLNGEWLLDASGNKIQANGVNGTNGMNGITPKLKIENEYWYISYDDGATWEQLGKATGNDGINGDNLFTSVTQDDDYVYFNLADGSTITLPKHDKENILFEDIRVKAICCKNWDTNRDGELSYTEAAAVFSISSADFSNNEDISSFPEFKYFTGIDQNYSNIFGGCKNLWKIELPAHLTKIESYMFKDCTNLSYIIIPDNVTTIEKEAFYNTNITSIVLPKSVTSIGERAFYTNGVIEIYCKAETPPAVYYDSKSGGGIINFSYPWLIKNIYVPAESYVLYLENRGGSNGEPHIGNWIKYAEYLKPYNFE